MIDEWYSTYSDDLLSFIRSRGLTPEQAEDVSAQVFLELVQRQAPLHDKNPRSLLFTIADHRIKDHWRRQIRRPEEELRETHIVDEVVQTGDIRALIDRLPSRQRDLIVWRFEGLPLCDIAARLNIQTKTVKSRLSRARRALKRLMEPSEPRVIPRAKLPRPKSQPFDSRLLDNRAALLARCLKLELENYELRNKLAELSQ